MDNEQRMAAMGIIAAQRCARAVLAKASPSTPTEREQLLANATGQFQGKLIPGLVFEDGYIVDQRLEETMIKTFTTTLKKGLG